MNEIEVLHWARGPGLKWALAVFLLGVVLRFVEMWLLGRKADLAVARASGAAGGWRTIFTRSLPTPGLVKTAALVFIGGYVFHIGLLIVLVLFVPHIELFRSLLGFGWPGLPSAAIALTAIVSMAALVALLVHRLMHPVRRFLSGFQDYFVWLVTFLPFLTGYLASHSPVVSYTSTLAAHILSVELLLVVFPFTKLIHALSFAVSRWYNGAIAGRKGVAV